MRCKIILLFALLLLLAGFGAAIIPGTAAEEQEEITGSPRSGGLWLEGMHSEASRELGILGDPVDGPVFRVIPQENFIYGLGWEPNAEITVEVDGEIEHKAESNDWGYFYLLEDVFEVEAGDEVIVEDGVTTKTHLVTELELVEVDRDENTVSGTAEANSELVVFVQDWTLTETIELNVDAGAEGNWDVSFKDEENYEIHEGTFVGAFQEDSDGDSTYNYAPPAPYFNVYPLYNDVLISNWSVDEDISIKILDEDNFEIDSFEVLSNEWGYYYLWDIDVDIKPGYTVEVHEGATNTTKTHEVTALEITDVDLENDIVSGETDREDWDVEFRVWDDHASAYLKVEEFDDGSWVADFSGEFDIAPGTSIEAWQADEERDTTAVIEHLPHPFFMVDPESNYIWGYDWMCAAEITITVNEDEFTTQAGEAPWPEPDCGDFFYDFDYEGLEIESGDKIQVTDDKTTLEHTVQYLEVTDVDVATDTVSGRTDSDALVVVEIHDHDGSYREVEADGNGNWEATFDEGDIEPGVRGSADRYDDEEDNAWTRVHWHAPDPYFNVKPEPDVIWGHDWPVEEENISIKVYDEDFDTLLHEDSTEADDEGYIDLHLGFDIQPGHWLEVSTEDVAKTHQVRDIALSEVDSANNIISGTTDKDSLIRVAAYSFDDHFTLADEAQDGSWEVDFTGHYSIDSESYGSAWQPDHEGNATWVDWQVSSPVPEREWVKDEAADADALALAYNSDDELTGAFPDFGVWHYDGSWVQMVGNESLALAYDGNDNLAGAFPGFGVYVYDGEDWTQLAPNDTNALAYNADGELTANFPGWGVYHYDGVDWELVTGTDANALAYNADGNLVASFPGVGVHEYVEDQWVKLSDVAASTLAAGTDLAGTFPGYGVWVYDGEWSVLTDATATSLAYNSTGDLAGAFGPFGVWYYMVK